MPNKHSLLVVGTVAFDSIETPHGAVDDALGGSATFFSYAASFFIAPRLVSVVGEDFPEANRQLLEDRNVDMRGLAVEKGKTFRWKGRYHEDMNTRDTLEVHLNMFGTFDPKLPEAFRDSTHVFLANGSPTVQAQGARSDSTKPQLVLADTMDLWINMQKPDLLACCRASTVSSSTIPKPSMLTGEKNMVRAGLAVANWGPRFVILKKGEHGAMLFSPDGVFVMPGFSDRKCARSDRRGRQLRRRHPGLLGVGRQPAARTVASRHGLWHRRREPERGRVRVGRFETHYSTRDRSTSGSLSRNAHRLAGGGRPRRHEEVHGTHPHFFGN